MRGPQQVAKLLRQIRRVREVLYKNGVDMQVDLKFKPRLVPKKRRARSAQASHE